MHRTLKRALALSIASAGVALLGLHGARAQLAHLTIDWSSFGPPGTAINTPASATFGPITVTIDSVPGAVAIVQEGFDYTGDFAPGTILIGMAYASDAFDITVSSSVPLTSVAAQMQPTMHSGGGGSIFPTQGWIGPATDAVSIEPSDLQNVTSIVTFNSTDAEDNSAPFVTFIGGGIRNIPLAKSFFIPQPGAAIAYSGNVAIGPLEVGFLLEPVPEPGALALLAVGLAGLGMVVRFRRA
jgi:hypothetical protein